MNCMQTRKYVGPFADGELDVERNLEVLAHLNMCPACTRRTADIPMLKKALGRIWAEERAPDRLREAIGATLAAAGQPAVPGTGPVPASPVSARPDVVRRMWVRLRMPLAVAATLFGGLLLWHQWRVDDVERGTMTVVSKRAAADVRDQHRYCVTHCPDHHDPTLPRDLEKIAVQMSERLKLAVIAPDMSAYGFDLFGADRCGVRGRPGAHLMYRSRTNGELLSIFTVARMDELHPDGLARLGNRDYFVDRAKDLTVVAWHDGTQTYAFCGGQPDIQLLTMAGDTPTADADDCRQSPIRLAAIQDVTHELSP